MDNSTPGPSSDKSDSHDSHSPAKRPRKQNESGKKPPKKSKKIVDKPYTDDLDGIEDESFLNSRLSEETREAVLKLKKIKDPFDDELQHVVDDVFTHFEQQPCDEVDLAESALLLSSVTQVYSSQVKTLHEEVLELAARLSGKELPQKGRRKKKPEDEVVSEEASEKLNKEGQISTNQNSEVKQNPETGLDRDKELGANGNEDCPNEPDSVEPVESTNPIVTPGQDNTEGKNSSEDNSGDANNNEEKPSQNPEGSDGTQEVVNVENEDKGNADPSTSEPTLAQLESEILNEIPARCTRRQSERLKNILNMEKAQEKEREYKLKKRKYDEDPPILISCDEEWENISKITNEQGDLDLDEILPPTLEVQVGRKRRKVTINNNEIESVEGNDCEACHLSTEEPETTRETTDLEPPFKLPNDVNSQQYETLDHLPNDIQESFHSLIQEMHKLPFDYGLMQQDMFKVYQQKFLQAVSLLSQNSVLVKRTDKEEEDEQPTASPSLVVLNDSQMSETDQTISSIAELLSQVRQQAAEDFNKGKQSKSDAEIPISQMIATLKRIICSRYKKWHVRTDTDKAVFTRIKEFEDKVKAVLRKEAEQGLFDVKKYEMEVMDVTLKESQDTESEEFGCPISPLNLPEGAESPGPEDNRNWNDLTLTSRRSSIAESIDGSSSWIRLYDIFSHMKKIDNSETCRHFYAVLALLSHQNLAINYDTLFSQESAKLITKLLKRQHGNVEKYPVGAKIMTSRCPDVDRDEILLTPVLSAAFKQALEQDGYLSSSGYQSDSQASTGTTINYSQTKSIQDAISEFVLDPGEPLVDDPFRTVRRKKSQTSLHKTHH